MHLIQYYIVYSVFCAALIVFLAVVLGRAGRHFLPDSFPGRPELARGVTHMLYIGFYLVSFGYVTLTMQTFMPMDTVAQVAQIVTYKAGWFLLLLGCLHFFNLFLLMLLRRRGGTMTMPAAS